MNFFPDAFRKENKVKFGLYHSLFEWFHPLYLEVKKKKTFSTRTVSNLFKDKSNNFTTRNFVVDKMGPELMEIINKYHPQVLWSDGDWEVKEKQTTEGKLEKSKIITIDNWLDFVSVMSGSG